MIIADFCMRPYSVNELLYKKSEMNVLGTVSDLLCKTPNTFLLCVPDMAYSLRN